MIQENTIKNAVGKFLQLVIGLSVFLLGSNLSFAQLADAPWASFQNDVYNSGRSMFVGSQTDSLQWTFETGGKVNSSPVIDKSGTIYFGSGDHNFYALNPDGTLKWKYQTNGEVTSTAALGANHTIYFGSADSNLYALSLDGTLKWKYNIGHPIENNPLIGEDGTVYITGTESLYAISAEGERLWDTLVYGYGISSTALGRGDQTIYVSEWADPMTGTCGAIHAVDVSTGEKKWNQCGAGDVTSAPTVGKDGTIYFGSKKVYESKWSGEDNNVLHAVSPEDSVKWEYGPIESILSSPAQGKNGVLYAGSGDGMFYAIDENGEFKWSYETIGASDEKSIHSSAAIDANGSIYFGSEDQHVYALNNDGTLQWKYNTGNMVGASPAIGPGGTIYIGSGNNLYAIGGTKSTPIDGEPAAPVSFRLKQNYPNPFNPTTRIQFSLPQASDVKLSVYNTLGQKVSTLINQKMSAGSHSVNFNASEMPSDVYIYRLKADGFSQSRKMLLVK